jgi:type IV pilus assembly protein PilM
LTSLTGSGKRAPRSGGKRGLAAWLDAMPHPSVVLEIAATHVAAARWGRTVGHLVSFAAEPLPGGAISPSATQPNVANAEALRGALRGVLSRVPAQGQSIALLIPDPVIRVFILAFDTFPRRAEEALPLLRWRLKKSLPFDTEEAVISWRRQESREGKPEVVAAVARQKIVREYESAVEEHGLLPGVVQSSTLATLPMLDPFAATLFARFSGRNLTTVIVRGDTLCVYRSTDFAAGPEDPAPQAVLDEIFPAVAFYQDHWGGKLERLSVAGLAGSAGELGERLARELDCSAATLVEIGELPGDARSLVSQGLEPLVGWQRNLGA